MDKWDTPLGENVILFKTTTTKLKCIMITVKNKNVNRFTSFKPEKNLRKEEKQKDDRNKINFKTV